MKNCVFRPARQDDLVDIINIWIIAFGDEPRFPRGLLSDCGLLKNALVAERDGSVVSFLLLYHGLKFGEYKACYLYALCTRPDCEGMGIGSALVSYAADTARSAGAQLLLLQPGDEDLERWYERMGFRTLWRSHWKSLDISGTPGGAAKSVSAREYLRSLSPDTLFTPELIASQNVLNSLCGGAFLTTDAGMLCAEYDGFVLHIRHASCDKSQLPHASAAAAEYFHAEHVSYLCRDDENGDNALMCLPLSLSLPELPGDMFFPFTLD